MAVGKGARDVKVWFYRAERASSGNRPAGADPELTFGESWQSWPPTPYIELTDGTYLVEPYTIERRPAEWWD